MKKKELQALKNGIEECRSLNGAIFANRLVKNYAKLVEEEKAIEGAKHKPSEKLTEYLAKETELLKNYAKKDDKGELIVRQDEDKNTHYTFDNIKEVNEAVKALKLEYPEAVEEIKKASEDFSKLLEEPLDIEFIKIKEADIPNSITVQQLAAIECLIED